MPAPIDPAVVQGISALITEFCWLVDNKQGERVADLFTEDATVDTPHFNLAGRDQIHAWFSKRANDPQRLSRHFWSNLRIVPDGANAYRAYANATTYVGAQPTPASTGRYAVGASSERIVVRDGAYLFASRTLEVLFEGAVVPGEKT